MVGCPSQPSTGAFQVELRNHSLGKSCLGDPRRQALKVRHEKRFLEDDTYFAPLAEDNNVLPFEHAYSHVNAFSSAMQAYITLGSEKHLRAARNGFEMVLNTQSFATGGWGPNEAFGEPGTGQLGNTRIQRSSSAGRDRDNVSW